MTFRNSIDNGATERGLSCMRLKLELRGACCLEGGFCVVGSSHHCRPLLAIVRVVVCEIRAGSGPLSLVSGGQSESRGVEGLSSSHLDLFTYAPAYVNNNSKQGAPNDRASVHPPNVSPSTARKRGWHQHIIIPLPIATNRLSKVPLWYLSNLPKNYESQFSDY